MARSAILLEGEQVFEITEDLQRKYVDVEVEVAFRRGPYAGTRSWDTKRFRVVGVRNEVADDYHFYITNVPRKWFLPADHSSLANSSGWLSNGSEPFLEDWTLLLDLLCVGCHPL